MSAEVSTSAVIPEKPWGIWATAGCSLLIYLVYAAAAFGVVVAIGASYAIDNPDLSQRQLQEIIASDGTIISGSTVISACFGILSLLFFVKIKKRISIKNYLCLHAVSLKSFVNWIFFTILFVIFADTLSYLLGRPIVPEFMVEQIRITPSILYLSIAIVVVAPIFEEMFFRGFLFAGIRQSRLGASGAILITALIWSVIHVQYDLYWIVTIFVLGLILGMARIKSNSLYVPLAMHMMLNAIATLEASILA
jgi:membrane protease YdiL (CAAX protease family)